MTGGRQKISTASGLLAAAVAVGAAMTLLQQIFSVDIYRDTANVYACMVRALVRGEYAEAFHPGIPQLNVVLALPFTWLGLRPEQALALVSELFYLATIPILYLLLREFLPKTSSAFGALLYACAPKIIRFSCTGLIDSGKIFFLVAGIFCAWCFVKGGFRSRRWALAWGAALGGLLLVRSEGVGNAAILYAGVAAIWLWRRFREKRQSPVVPMLIVLLPLAAAILFRMWCNWRFCGYFMFDLRIHNWLCLLLGKPRVVIADVPVPAAPTAAAAPSVLKLWLEVLELFVVGNYEVYFGFAMLGLALVIVAKFGKKWHVLWPDRQVPAMFEWNALYFIIWLNAIGNLLIFRLSKIASYRYFLINIPLLIVFAVIAACWLWSWGVKLLPKWMLAIPLLGVAFLLAVQIENGAENFFSEKSYVKYRSGLEVGKIIRREKPDAKVWFKQACVEWYYSGQKRAVPIETAMPDPRTFDAFDYVLMDKTLDDAEKKTAAIVTARPDIVEIPMFEDSTVRLFRKIEVK